MSTASTTVVPMRRRPQAPAVADAQANGAGETTRRAWRRRAICGSVCAIVAWGAIAYAERRVPTGPAAGSALLGPRPAPARTRETFRVCTFNMHGGKGLDGEFNVDRSAACVKGFDFVGLNEVRGGYFWEEADQAELAARRLNAAWLFAPTERKWFHFEFGNALVSHAPVTSWQRIPLERHGAKSFRNCVLATVELPGGHVRVLVTHLDNTTHDRRHAQLNCVANLFLSLAEPAILMGDLNTREGDEGIEALLATPGVDDPVRAVLGEKTPSRLDWIITRGLDSLDAGIENTEASDHPRVWAELRVRGPRR